MSPWQILGIPYGSSRSVVKEAYARLLKEHRPDRDPVGFRRIRDAYEQLRDVPESTEPEPWDEAEDEDEPEPITFAAEPAPYAFDEDGDEGHEVARFGDDDEPDEDPPDDQEAIDPPLLQWRLRTPFHLRLSRALYRMSVQTDPQRELRVLRVLVHSWRQGKRSPTLLVNLLRAALRQKPLVQTLLTPTDVVNELDGGAWAVTIALLHAYLVSDDMAALHGVLHAIETWSVRHPNGNCGPLLVEAAGVLAFVDHAAAERLLDAAFRGRVGNQLPTDHIDLRMAAGRELRASKRADQLLFTRALLLPPDRRTEDDESQAAAAMRQRHGSAPLLAALFKASLPKWWDYVIAAPIEVNPPQQPFARPRPVRPHEPLLAEPEARRLSRAEAIAWLLVLLVIVGIGRLVLRTPDKRPPASFGMPRATPVPNQEQIRSLLWPEQGNRAVPPPAPGKPAGGR